MGFRSDHWSRVCAARSGMQTPACRPVRDPALAPHPILRSPSDTPPPSPPQPQRPLPRSPALCTRFGRSPQPPTWWGPEPREAARSARGGPRVVEARSERPSLASPLPGPPHFLSRREATLRRPAFPGASRAPWRPPRGRALGTRGSLSGPPFPGSGPAAGGGLSPPRAPEPSHAGRALPLQLPASPRTPGSLVARPRPSQPCVKVPALVAWGSPFSQVCPSRHIRVFQHAEKKMPHARTYLFILQQLQETMKLFKNRGNALSSRAVVFQ